MARRKVSERQQIIRKAAHLRSLLAEFGATLCGFDPGVTALLPSVPSLLGGDGRGYFGEPLAFSKVEWQWLEPLLIELQDLRGRK